MKDQNTGDLRSQFMLETSVHFLNHGSFGACPIPVFQVYQDWQLRLERQPVKFLGREYSRLDQIARQPLSEYIGTKPENICFIPNATTGVNIIARSLQLQLGDEILSSDHEYGACMYAWEYACQQTGAIIICRPIPLPLVADDEFLDIFLSGISSRTRIIYLSHITSPTAIAFPLEKICGIAREKGILTVIDGAHAPGQIPLQLDALGVDFYIGNCHKWMLSPKGAGFLYANPSVQNLIQPLIVSWGFHPAASTSIESQFQDFLQWTGTRDPSAYFSVPTAINFMKDHDWPNIQLSCHDLLEQTIHSIENLFSLEGYYVPSSNQYYQMGIAPLPQNTDPVSLKNQLYTAFHVEIPVIEWNGRKFLRISIQAYNTREDCEVLLQGLRKLILS